MFVLNALVVSRIEPCLFVSKNECPIASHSKTSLTHIKGILTLWRDPLHGQRSEEKLIAPPEDMVAFPFQKFMNCLLNFDVAQMRSSYVELNHSGIQHFIFSLHKVATRFNHIRTFLFCAHGIKKSPNGS